MRRIELLLLTALLISCGRKELNEALEPSRALGQVTAEEAARAAGPNKTVALITHDASWGEPSTAEQSFRAAAKRLGLTVTTAKAAALGDPMHSGEVGLKATDFLDALKSSANAGAVVSLVGAPPLRAEEVAALPPKHPPVLVVATQKLGFKIGVPTAPAELAALLDAKTIQAAIIDRGAALAEPPQKPDAIHQVFSEHYRILRAPK